MKAIKILVSVLTLAIVTMTYDRTRADDSHHVATVWVDGQIKKVDKDAGKLTVKHGPLTNLDMPAMTMVFRVNDPAMLDQVKVGDEVWFSADRVDGRYTVMKLELKK